ncbi:P-loop containing nucleoside triphosphate hydrolase protein [Stipitochalara longipes BDJ]|nr:P-loop containing nucleoside triphosphate hydrolase protein [Stipitochalara longipes BDJ]
MAQVAIGNGSISETSTRELISDLEERYVKLLESKISRFELQLATVDEQKPSPNHKGATKGDGGDTTAESEEENELKHEGEHPVEKEEPRYSMIISKWNSDSGDFTDTDASKKDEKKEIGPQPQSRRAFTFRKITAMRHRYQELREGFQTVSSEVEIEFEPLQRLIVTKCRAPYSPLIFSWLEALREAQKIVEGETEDEKQARTDLAELLKIISTSSGHLQLDRYFKERDTFLAEKSITHGALWTLFPPGTLILANPFLEEPQIFSVQSCDGFVSDDDPFHLVCYSFDWNGFEFNRVAFELTIESWGDDRKSIIELPFYPLDYYEGSSLDVGNGNMIQGAIEKLKNKLIKRGKRYEELCVAEKGKQMFNYDGTAHFQRGGGIMQPLSSDPGGEQDRIMSYETRISLRAEPLAQIKGATMLDFVSFFEYQPPKTPILGHLRRYGGQLESLSPERRAKKVFQDMYKFDWDKHQRGKQMSDLQYLLCPPRVLGYALKQKKWAQLLVDRLFEPDEADASTFEDKLQLEDDFKELIKKSVQAHELGKKKDASGRSKALEDFAPEKGKGLILMLYGLPGVGKTLTAESVALMAGKPLFSIGVSDIGIDGDKVEANLQKVFDLAGTWEAVLLFDEADVFLEARGEGENDLKRNAMVSVLLRVLEYYDGILILTTNRMRSFDIAVQSRIHLAIKYEELSPEQKTNIFMSFLEQLANKHLVADFEDIKKWVNKHGRKFSFNGRQIRNVVSTALGIALMEEGKVISNHLVRVAVQTNNFKADLKTQEGIYIAKHHS